MSGVFPALAVALALATPTAEAAPRLPGTAAAGVTLARMRPGVRRHLGVPAGLLVVETTAGGPAEQAGLRAGDVLVEANEGRVFSPGQVSLLVSLNRGEAVPVLYYRAGLVFASSLQVPARERSLVRDLRAAAAERRAERASVATDDALTVGVRQADAG